MSRVPKIRSHLISVVLLCFLSLFILLWMSTNSRRTLVINVETLVSRNTLVNLYKVIQAQKSTIDHYAQGPKVIYRCLDDEPKIKYPRHATDDMTAVTMGTNDECGHNSSSLDAVVIVHSSADHFGHRRRFRIVYSDLNVTWPYRLKVVFLLGQVLNAEVQINIELENMKYGDTIQGNFLDTYQNLTMKAVMGYRWISETCSPGYKMVLKLDDDVILDVHRFFGAFIHPLRIDKKTRRIFCQVWTQALVNRDGKWNVEKGLFANKSYDFPYCSGFMVGVTPDLVLEMYETAKKSHFFWIDDVFMYGMVPKAMKKVGYTQLGRHTNGLITQNHGWYKSCVEKKAENCSYLAVVVSGEKTFFETFYQFPHQKRKFQVTNSSGINMTKVEENPSLTNPKVKENPSLTNPKVKENPSLTNPKVNENPSLTNPKVKENPSLTNSKAKENPSLKN